MNKLIEKYRAWQEDDRQYMVWAYLNHWRTVRTIQDWIWMGVISFIALAISLAITAPAFFVLAMIPILVYWGWAAWFSRKLLKTWKVHKAEPLIPVN